MGGTRAAVWGEDGGGEYAAKGCVPAECGGGGDAGDDCGGWATTWGVLIDTGHSHCSGTAAGDDVRAAGGKLIGLHVHDNDGTGDSHLAPGEGTIDWQGFVMAADGMDFGGPWTIEVAPGEGGYAATLARIRAAMGFLGE